MKILHVDTGETWRGGQAQVYNLLKNFPDGTIENHLVSPPDTPLHNRLSDDGVNVRLHTHALRGEWDLSAVWRLNRLQAEHDFDFWHAHDSHGLGIAWLAKIFSGDVGLLATRRLELAVAQNVFSKQKYRSVDQFIAISSAVKESLEESGMNEDDIAIIPSGVDLDQIKKTEPDPDRLRAFGLNPEQPVVGNIGALTEQKDQKTFVDAAAIVLEEYPETQFVIAGEGVLHDDLQERINEKNLEERVVLAGFQEEIIALLKTFDLFVLTSIFEGLCSTLLQVMAAKVPIVATDVGGVSDLVEDDVTGRLTPPESPEATANRIREFLENPEVFSPYVDEAYDTVQPYDYEQLARRTAQLYESITER